MLHTFEEACSRCVSVCVCVCQMDMGVHHMPGVCAPSVRSDKLHAGMAT